MYSRMDGSKSNLLTRNNSICPTPEDKLLELVLNNETEEIENTVNEKLLNHIYKGYNKPILLIACIEDKVTAPTIKSLINSGANLRFYDENQWEALHFAAKRSNKSILSVIIEGLKSQNVDINEVLADGSNALHILIRYGNNANEEFIDCIKLLVDEGININQPDNKAMSPTLWAAKKGLKEAIKIIIESGKNVDLDSHKSRGQSSRDLIMKDKLYDGDLPEKVDNNNMILQTTDILFNYIKLGKEEEFIKCSINDYNADNGNNTLLQLAVDKGCKSIVKHLLDKGADRYITPGKNKKIPLQIAAEHGFYEIFNALLHNYTEKIPNTVLISLLKYYDSDNFQDINRSKCCQSLLEKYQDLNGGDESKNTPLHYAVRYGDAAIINQLLDRGASLGSKNKYGIMPVEDIEPELLEQHLDNCVQFDYKGKKDKEDFVITFNYRTLIPPCDDSLSSVQDPEYGLNGGVSKALVHETEVISHMSNAPEFKHLLAHPVIVSFLFMKWHRIRWLFCTNLAFYVAFFLALVSYIFSYYTNFNDLTSFQTFIRYLSYSVLLITFFVLFFREFFQIVILPTKYFKNFENYVEIILLVLSGCILFIKNPSNDTRKQLSSLSILLAAFELILMMGQHPKLSTNVVMLKTVSYNFFKFLLWYSLLIIAFALSFFILYTDLPSDNNEEGDDTFADPGKSVFKTIVMLTGEFEAGEMNFKTFPIVSKLIFVLFIFMIAIILLNLLNGLAVSDTQMIKNDAELLGHITRAQHIRYVEIMLLGNIVPKNLLKKINDLCCCFPFAQNWNYNMFKPLAEKVCLFPHLFPSYEMTVYPNRHGQISIPVGKKDKCCYRCCQNVYLDKETIKRTNDLVQAKKERRKIDLDGGTTEVEINRLNNKIEQLEKLVLSLGEVVEKKL